MEINFNKIKQNVKVNGISFNNGAANPEAFSYISTAISLYRMRHSNAEIMQKLADLKAPGYDEYAMGRRFLDNEMVATRLLSGIKNAFQGEGVDTFSEEGVKLIKFFVDSLSGEEMDTFILESLRDCASADHWYMYEKQWD